MNEEQFIAALEEQGISLTKKQLEQFETYFQLLVEWNQKMNLTAITEKTEVYLKHFYDSITLAFSHSLENSDAHLCDVGAGAGFPSIPLKIVFPDLHVTIVDSLKKRITFLETLADALELENVAFYHDRAETFGQNPAFREQFDLVTARAVARLNVLAEFCLPLVKKDGYFCAMKAAKSQEELDESKKAIALLGGKLVKDVEFTLPHSHDPRHIIVIQKKKETPKKYPRKPGTPLKQPIL